MKVKLGKIWLLDHEEVFTCETKEVSKWLKSLE